MLTPAKTITIKRTEASDPDFPRLVSQLNQELRDRYGELQVVYDKYNHISNLDTVVIGYVNDMPAGCGCFKRINDNTAEIKRMFVKASERQQGIASMILSELEIWAKEDGYANTLLETANKQHEAIAFYNRSGYVVIPNYGPYAGIETSICFQKKL